MKFHTLLAGCCLAGLAAAPSTFAQEADLLPRPALDELALVVLADDLGTPREDTLVRDPDRDKHPATGELLLRYRARPRSEADLFAERILDPRGRILDEDRLEAQYGVDLFAAVDDENPCLGASFSGVKFHDLDQDGVRDPDEPLIPGWPIVVSDGYQSYLGHTGADGAYWICAPIAGQYIVHEISQPGWTQTAPASGQHLVIPTSDLNLDFTDLDFGNYSEADDPCADFSVSVSCGGISQVNGEWQCTGFPSGGQAPYQYTWNVSPTPQYWTPQGTYTSSGVAHLFAECVPDNTPPFLIHTGGLTVVDANGCVASGYGEYMCTNYGGGGGGHL